jgi:quercetin dioxygenase-like cupin family protein
MSLAEQPREYPPALYTGEAGEVSAIARLASRTPEIRRPNGSSVSYLATGADTGGKFGLYRWDFAPEPSGPSPHFHRTMTESFFILSGTVRLYNGETWLDAVPGDFLHVPEGGIHAFRNESGKEASMLILFSPGAPREPYFETLANQATQDRKMTPEERTQFLLRHDNHFVP